MDVKLPMDSAGSDDAKVPIPVPHVVAHRGNACEYPENTLASLRSAIDIGVHFVEFDVHLSADEIPVVIHDESLVRTAGRPESVFELNARDLLKVEVTERSRFGDRFRDIRIPSLEQAAELLSAHPQVTAFVEIKRASLRRFGIDTVISRVVERLKPILSQCVVISFELAAIHQSRRAGAAAIGWVLDRYDGHSRLKYEALKPDYLFCDRLALPNDGATLWRGPWRWASYEVEQVADAMALAARGVHLIETMAVRALTRGLETISLGDR